MDCIRFYPKVDKLFWWAFVPSAVYMLTMTVVMILFPEPLMIAVTVAVNLVVIWALVAPLCGYVELRGDCLYVRFGFFLSRSIPYSHIRKVQKERHWYSESILSLKSAMEHVNVRYNFCDVVTISVKDNDALLTAIQERLSKNA